MIGSPRVYYAHHLWKYNTEIEKFEIDTIKNKLSGCIVVNPNGAVPQDGNISEAAAMDRCFKLINDCSALVFSTYSEVVGRGVYQEVHYAQDCGKLIYIISGDSVYKCDNVKFRIIDEGKNPRLYAVVV